MFSGLSRRQFLRLIGFSVAGIAAVGSIPLFGTFLVRKAQAQVVSEEVYKTRSYRIVTNVENKTPQTLQEGSRIVETPYQQPIKLYLDDKLVSVIQDKKTNKYRTHLLPFTEYNSPREVARDLIDKGVQVPQAPPTFPSKPDIY